MVRFSENVNPESRFWLDVQVNVKEGLCIALSNKDSKDLDYQSPSAVCFLKKMPVTIFPNSQIDSNKEDDNKSLCLQLVKNQ